MLIGREKEKEILLDEYQKNQSSFVAIYGRRRVGKTFLIKELFGNSFTFYFTGSLNSTKSQTINRFKQSLIDYGLVSNNKKIKNWDEAFNLLKDVIERSNRNKKIIFIDELSWLDSKKDRFIDSLEYFWNSYASGRKDVLLIVASSSASWMVDNIIMNRGGLYGRLSYLLHLNPFSLKECKKFLQEEKGIHYNDMEVLRTYMVFGGVPYYWDKIAKGFSPEQNIDRLLFGRGCQLENEYDKLFQSIFNNYQSYLSLIEILVEKRSGMTREEIIDKLKITSNGYLTEQLNKLEQCNFIRSYNNYEHKKNKVYQVIDEFVLFYHHFLKKNGSVSNYWISNYQSPKYNTWAGLAYESICFKHINQIKKALGILGVISVEYSYYPKRKNEENCQIDLLIDRNDQIINLCEIKYSLDLYSFKEEELIKLNRRLEVFRNNEKIRKSIWNVLICTNGIKEEKYKNYFEKVIYIKDLFSDVD